MNEILKRDQNFVTVLAGVTNDSDKDITMLRVDPISKRLLILASFSGGVVTTINGLSGAITLAAGSNITITPSGNTLTFASTGGSGPTLPLSLPNGGWGITNTRTADTSSGTLNDHVLSSVWTEFTTTSNSIVLTGIAAMPDGTEIILTKNTASGLNLTVVYASTSSLAANRIVFPQQQDLIMKNQSSIRLRYDGSISRWRFLEGLTPSNSNGVVQFASVDGSIFTDDGSNFIYAVPQHRLILNNLQVNSFAFLGGITIMRGPQMTNDGVIPFTYTSTQGQGSIGGDLDLYWDNANKQMGLGTRSPAYQLDVTGNTLTLPAPLSFSSTLQSESLANPPTDSLGLFYTPLDTTFAFTSLDLAASGYNTSTTVSISYLIFSYRHDSLSNTWTSPSGFPITFNFPYPLSNSADDGSVENPSYSGYNNNDTVSAVVYGYNNAIGGGIKYTSTGSTLATITLSNNPSGIDWFWNAGTLADGNPVSGYIIEITDQTTSTVYSYDVGAATNYIDMNAGGTVSYTPFSSSSIDYALSVNWSPAINGDNSPVDGFVLAVSASSTNYFDVGNTTGYFDQNSIGSPTNPYPTFASQGGFTSSGQFFEYDMFVMGISPSGGNYFNDNGNGFIITITESLNNGTLFWVQHNIGSTGGNSWRELENDFFGSGGFDGSGDVFFYQVTGFTGTTTTTPNHYGIQSDGSTLNRVYTAYNQATSPSTYYSSSNSPSATFDPNDFTYYYIVYNYSTTGGLNVKTLENINGAGDTGSVLGTLTVGTFYQDALGGAFSGDTVITPTSLPQAAGRFQNALLLSPVALLTSITNGAFEYDGVHLYFTIGSTRHTII